MKRKRLLTCFVAVFLLFQAVFPSRAAGPADTNGILQTVNTGESSEPGDPAAGEESSEPGDPAAGEESSEPGGPAAGEESSEPGGLSGTGESSKPGDLTEAEEPSGQAGPSEGKEPAMTENMETVTVLGEAEAVSAVLYSAPGDGTDALLADFDFDDKSLTDGADITTDTVKVTGSYSLTESYTDGGKALYLGGNQYLTVTKPDGNPLLTGLTELTVSMELKPDRADTNWAFYAAPNESAQEYLKEKYLGVFQNSGEIQIERYLNSGSRPPVFSRSVGTDWVHVDVVFAENETILYVDGVEAGRESSDYGLQDILGENSILWIGKANWGSGEYYKGWIDDLKICGKALTEEEIQAVPSEAYKEYALSKAKSSLEASVGAGLVINDGTYTFSDFDGTVTWQVPEDGTLTDVISMDEDGLTAEVKQPAAGSGDAVGTMTAVVSVYGKTAQISVNTTVKDLPKAEEAYGYLMVHFIEDGSGYAEKIYLDISRGDDPEKWDPLNGGEPILASNLGTTGTRDPFLTYNPETKKYYIIATDLRVFGGDNAQWGVWSSSGSTMMNVWESEDLISWSDVRQFDVTLDADGDKAVKLGMMWAPEATWVPDYYGEGKGAFVVYWSSCVYDDSGNLTGGSDILWGATTDFTQETWTYGGEFLDGGEQGWIDTTILQNGNTTYHITKSHAEGIIMESTTDKEWWKAGTEWKRVQTGIGDSRFGAVEGPAVFRDHSQDGRWYLFVDDLPTPGYQPMISTDLSRGWDYLDSPDYFLTENTKHGGVISLTKAQYDALRGADAREALSEKLSPVEIEKNTSQDMLLTLLPAAEVQLYGGGTGSLPVQWDLSNVDLGVPGEYEIPGVVCSIGSNNNQWVGKNDSTSYLAEDKELYSSTQIVVRTTVTVKESTADDTEDPDKPKDPDSQGGSKEPSKDSTGGSAGTSGSRSSHKHSSPASDTEETVQAAPETVNASATGDIQSTELWILLSLAAGAAVLTYGKRSRK